MKLLLSSLLLGGCLWCLDAQATEDSVDEEQIVIHHMTPEELTNIVGKDKLEKVVAYAPKVDFMKDDIVSLYGIGRQRIKARICTLEQNNMHTEAAQLKELLGH